MKIPRTRKTPLTTEAPTAAKGSPRTFVVFSVDGTKYALPVEAVLRTLQFPAVTRLPAAGPRILGVFQHGGRVITLFDLRAWFAAFDFTPADPWVVVALAKNVPRGLLVDQVLDVLTLPGAEIVPGPAPPIAAAPAVRGVLQAAPSPDDEEPPPPPRRGLPPGTPKGPIDQEEAERRSQAASCAALRGMGAVHVLDLAALFATEGAP